MANFDYIYSFEFLITSENTLYWWICSIITCLFITVLSCKKHFIKTNFSIIYKVIFASIFLGSGNIIFPNSFSAIKGNEMSLPINYSLLSWFIILIIFSCCYVIPIAIKGND